MRRFARLSKGAAIEIIDENIDILKEWHPDFLANLVEITKENPEPTIGWTRSAQGVWSAPEPFVASPKQQMSAAVAQGFKITSKDTPNINGTYDAVGDRWRRMRDEAQYIAIFDGFSGDQEKLEWQSKTGEVVFSSIAQFKSVVKGIADRLSAWQRFADGKIDAAPAGDIEVA